LDTLRKEEADLFFAFAFADAALRSAQRNLDQSVSSLNGNAGGRGLSESLKAAVAAVSSAAAALVKIHDDLAKVQAEIKRAEADLEAAKKALADCEGKAVLRRFPAGFLPAAPRACTEQLVALATATARQQAYRDVRRLVPRTLVAAAGVAEHAATTKLRSLAGQFARVPGAGGSAAILRKIAARFGSAETALGRLTAASRKLDGRVRGAAKQVGAAAKKLAHCRSATP
jgi:hypothetical protein